ncbi:MAG: hypothetical protein Q7J29_00925 [Stagnimonas sp.]|nr:hypothetical protein [Stagnimonas sp.]
MNVDLAKLPAAVVDRAMQASGARTARGLVLAALRMLADQPASVEAKATARSKKWRGSKEFDTAKQARDYIQGQMK